jgi:hypothetical protein
MRGVKATLTCVHRLIVLTVFIESVAQIVTTKHAFSKHSSAYRVRESLSLCHIMEQLPDDIMTSILCLLTDVRSIAAFTLTSRTFRDAAHKADLIHKMQMPFIDCQKVLHPANLEYSKEIALTHCVYCMWCRSIIPVPLEAVVFNHRCENMRSPFPQWTNQRTLLYRGITDHLPQPIACKDERLSMYQVSRPKVFPYLCTPAAPALSHGTEARKSDARCHPPAAQCHL